jgi:hypothetical protein
VLSRSRLAFLRPHRPSIAGLAVAAAGLALATGIAAFVHLGLGV